MKCCIRSGLATACSTYRRARDYSEEDILAPGPRDSGAAGREGTGSATGFGTAILRLMTS